MRAGRERRNKIANQTINPTGDSISANSHTPWPGGLSLRCPARAAVHVKCACTIRLQVIAKADSICSVKVKHVKTLRAIFAKPTLASIAFGSIESLLVGLGAELSEREGSRVKFSLRGEEWHAHRPHPGKEAKKYQVEGVREFLERLEIKP